MNKVILIGRLTKDADVRYTQNGDKSTAVARFNMAVDRRGKKDEADFISCVAFGKTAEFVEKYTSKGTKLAVTGRIQTGSYTNKDNVKVYTTDVVVEDCEFCEKKEASGNAGFGGINAPVEVENDGFMNVPEGIDEDLPFACP